MTDATITSAVAAVAAVPAASGVVVDIEATIKAEVAKLLAEAKAEESALATKFKAFVDAHYSKVVSYGLGAISVYVVLKFIL